MSSRFRTGSVAQDNRSKVWNFFWWENGKRRCKALGRFSTKAAAWKAAKPLRDATEKPVRNMVNVGTLVEQYRTEKMATRYSTRRAYEVWLKLYILPRWGSRPLTELQARPVELWLASLTLAPRSKGAIRGLLHLLWDYAQWRGDVSLQRNPMELVTIKNASKRQKHARSLSVDEFHRLVANLEDPFRTIALVSVCFGLRISECLALKWSDVDWLNARLSIQRSIVRQRVGDTKTEYSNRPLTIDAEMLAVLKEWKQVHSFLARRIGSSLPSLTLADCHGPMTR